MNGITELLGRRRIRIVCAKVCVIGLVAVRAPMALVFAGVRVVDDDAVVTVTVGNVDFIRILIDEDLCRPPQVFDVVTAFAGANLADLHQELSILSELHDHAVVGVTLNARGLTLAWCSSLRRLLPTPGRAARSCGSRGRSG